MRAVDEKGDEVKSNQTERFVTFSISILEKRMKGFLLFCRQAERGAADGPCGARVGDGPAQRDPLLRREGRQPGRAGQRALVLRRRAAQAGERDEYKTPTVTRLC